MNGILFWVIPPLFGAFIGYITNAVAIKMLFRPLQERRLFGLRLPFTPGILPRERHKLADSIGRMVEQELLTSEVLRERLAKTEVREKIGITVGEYTDQMLKRPLSYWLENREETFPLTELLGAFINSDVFDSFLEEIIRNWAGDKASAEDETVSSWLTARFRGVGKMLIPAVRGFIKNGLVRDIKNHARGEPAFYRRALAGITEKYPGITLGEFLSLGEPKKRPLDSFLAEKAAGTLEENIEGALSSVEVKTLVADRINSLDMLRVEKIVLDVMAGQLKWINFFGAILGALIGFMQILLSLMRINPGI
jgi:uncharacterized membrane protein YheB (UPF0754 family)